MQAMRASDSTWCRRGFDWQPETLGLDKNDENQSKKAKNKAMHMWASDSTWCRCGFDLARLKTRPWGPLIQPVQPWWAAADSTWRG
jgi:hypothetical protein